LNGKFTIVAQCRITVDTITTFTLILTELLTPEERFLVREISPVSYPIQMAIKHFLLQEMKE
jgi:hypothetical protein